MIGEMFMKKLKIYIDTSVVSHLDQQDAPEKMYDTKMLWEMIKSGEYEVYISPVTLAEVMECEEPKKSILLNYLSDIDYTELIETDSVFSLANKYIEAGILRPKSLDDSYHIAYACVCDYVMQHRKNVVLI